MMQKKQNGTFRAALRVLAVMMLLAMGDALPEAVWAAKPAPEIVGDAAVLIDARTGTVLYDKNMHKQKYPASTTKVMTGLLALENLKLSDVVTIDAETPFTKGARIYLLEGERVTVGQLLHALLVESANDAAVALANEISGSTEEFAKLMNRRAGELGAENTNFVNPNGLEHGEHVTSAYDLAMIAKEAMTWPAFREAVSTYRYVLPRTNKQEERYLYNTNRLLYDEKTKIVYEGETRGCRYEGATGIKTGYTRQAGRCLIAGAERNGTELIAVILQSEGSSLYLDAVSLLEYGFDNYHTALVMESGVDLGTLSIRRGAEKNVDTASGETTWVTLPSNIAAEMLTMETHLEENLTAPVKKGDRVGEVRVMQGEDWIATVPVVAGSSVEKGGLLSIFGIPDRTAALIRNVILILVGGFFLLVFVWVMLKRRQIRRRKQRRAERAERLAAEQERRRRELFGDYDELRRSI